jgi:predicted PurR-regulated permease PerM
MPVTSPPVAASPSAAGPSAAQPLWRRAWLVVGVLVLAGIFAFILWRGASTFYYVLMAWFAALAMEPVVSRLSTRMNRGLATGLVMFLAGLFFVIFLGLFGALFVEQLTSFIVAIPGMAEDALSWFNRVSNSSFTFDTILDSIGLSPSDLTAYADDVAFGVLGLLGSLLSGFFGAFVLVFFTFYISAGMPTLRGWIAHRMRPRLQVPFLTAWDLTGIKVGGYIAARIVLAAINAFLSGIVFAIIGLPYWLPLALWTGLVAQFIPNIGTYIAIALPVLVGLTSPDPIVGIYVLIWGIAYQQVENLAIEPRISSRAVNLHPAVSFGAALLGAQLFGLSGALLGVPVAAMVMAMLEIYQRRYELSPATEARVAALVAPRANRSDAGSIEDAVRLPVPASSSPSVGPEAREDPEDPPAPEASDSPHTPPT